VFTVKLLNIKNKSMLARYVHYIGQKQEINPEHKMYKHMNLLKVALVTLTLGAFSSAHATIWNIDQVLQGSDGGFGYSGFHDSSGANMMHGSDLGSIDSGTGTYNDVTGFFSGTFMGTTVNDGPALFTLTTAPVPSAELLFGASNELLPLGGILSAQFIQGTGALTDGFVFFTPGVVCCTGPEAPNSFVDHNDGTATLSLWGATNNGPFANVQGAHYGMDLKVTFTSVPTPSVLSLFGLGMLMMGIRRGRAVRAV